MRVLILDTWSAALDFGMRCQEWGHEVIWFDQNRKDGTERLAGRGIVPKLTDFNLVRRYVEWADLVVTCDNLKYLYLLEPFRKDGYPIFGPSQAAADLELDRAKGQEAMKSVGLKTIPGVEFNDYDKAAAYVEKHPTFLVSKPSGDADKALSYVADDAASLIYMLTERWKKNSKCAADAKKCGFILQEKVKGVEMAVGGFFGPGGWSKWWYENFEYKKLMAGDMGPNTGEQGTLSMMVQDSKLADVALKPMTKLLHKLEYVGFIDNNGMIDDGGEFWPFEFTMRPPWPGFHNVMAHLDGDPCRWMVDLLQGRDTLPARGNEACVSVVVAIPPYPYTHALRTDIEGIPVYGATDREHAHLCEIMVADDVPTQVGDKVVRLPGYVTAGEYVMVMTGTGETITGARRSVYAALDKVSMPGSPFWRPDIGRGRLIEGLPKIQKQGFAKHFTMA